MNKRSDKVWLPVHRLLLCPLSSGDGNGSFKQGEVPRKVTSLPCTSSLLGKQAVPKPLLPQPRWPSCPLLGPFPGGGCHGGSRHPEHPCRQGQPGPWEPMSSRNWSLRVNGAKTKLSEAAQNSGSSQASGSSVQSTLVIIRSKNLIARSLTV